MRCRQSFPAEEQQPLFRFIKSFEFGICRLKGQSLQEFLGLAAVGKNKQGFIAAAAHLSFHQVPGL